jgi:hypothetical protein
MIHSKSQKFPESGKLWLRISKKYQKKKVVKPQPIVDENTECNYLVMFFIVGVLALAAMDSVKK